MNNRLTFVFSLAILIYAIDAIPIENRGSKTCKNFCIEQDFDRMICAFDGSDMRHFPGLCMMKFYNKCHQTSK